MNIVIVLSGTRCSGKTEIARRLLEKSEVFILPKAYTSRKARKDDIDQYIYDSIENIVEYNDKGELLTFTEYCKNYYGYKEGTIIEAFESKKIPIITIAPKCIKQIEKWNEKNYNIRLIEIFVDSDDEILKLRYSNRYGELKDEYINELKEDRDNSREYTYRLKNNRSDDLLEIIKFIKVLIKYDNSSGILSYDIIMNMTKIGMLIDNPDYNNIKNASYDLSVGDDFYINESIKGLSKKSGFIKIDPGNYAIIESKEIVNLPNNICGRFDLRVGLFCKGLILSNSTQVDPGFHGRLLCLIFNPSNDTVELKMGDRYATIEFNKMIKSTIPYNGKYQEKTEIFDYLSRELKPSIIKKNIKDIDNLKKEKIIVKILPIAISLIGIIIAIIGLSKSSSLNNNNKSSVKDNYTTTSIMENNIENEKNVIKIPNTISTQK